MVKTALLLFVALLFSLPCRAATEALDVDVYGNRALSDEAVINMAGIDQNPGFTALEVKHRLETSGLFSKIKVWRTESAMTIVVKEKTTWFALPYFSIDDSSKTFGIAGGKASFMGQDSALVGRAQLGTDDQEFNLIGRDEFFLDSLWSIGGSLDYEDSLHRVFDGRDVSSRFAYRYYGGSFQVGYHFTPYSQLGLTTYVEQHRFEDFDGQVVSGLQLSHRLTAEYGNFYVNEGLARGKSARIYFEFANPVSSFQFLKLGAAGQASLFLYRDFDWIIHPRFEVGSSLPRYQLFELGGGRLRSFPSQEFRGPSYVSCQNDFLLTSTDIWRFKVRSLLYADWAFVQSSARPGVGGGLQFYLHDVAVPAVQFYAGYGFNPNGFSTSIAVGPQF